jgi:MFS family permease
VITSNIVGLHPHVEGRTFSQLSRNKKMEFNKLNSDDAKGLKAIFRALNHRNYRLFFGGQGISLIGTWMQQVAMSWLVYRMTHSAFLLGVAGFLGLIPTFLLAPFSGVLSDRLNRHRILVITQTLAMIQAFVLAILDLTGTIDVWHLIMLILFLGFVNAFDAPARQSFVVDMVEKKEDLSNAIALNSFLFNGARLVGPSIGGIVISILGEGMCFFLNGLSFLAVIVALLAMKIRFRKRETQRTQVWQGLKEGFTYAFGFAPIRFILFLLSLVSLMGMPYTVLMPIFAKDILHGGPHTLGFLMAASGMGAVAGAIYLASRKSVLGLGRIIVTASIIFGSGLITFSLSHVLWFSLSILAFTGFGMMVQMASSNTILQTIVEEDKRGRVMSFYMMSFMGMAPFGSLLAGSVASKIGAPNTLIIGGASCIVGAFMFGKKLSLIRKMVRPIYLEKGIISEELSTIQ